MPDLAGELGLLFLLPASKAAANLWETLHVNDVKWTYKVSVTSRSTLSLARAFLSFAIDERLAV